MADPMAAKINDDLPPHCPLSSITSPFSFFADSISACCGMYAVGGIYSSLNRQSYFPERLFHWVKIGYIVFLASYIPKMSHVWGEFIRLNDQDILPIVLFMVSVPSGHKVLEDGRPPGDEL